MTVARAKREMSSAEFTEWIAYAELEPFGGSIDDSKYGMLMAMIANIHRDSRKHPQAFAAHDFTPWREKPRVRQQSQEYMASVLGTYLTAMQRKFENG